MNPSAARYTPTFSLQRRKRHELPITAKSAGPQPTERSTATVSPMVLPRETPSALDNPNPYPRNSTHGGTRIAAGAASGAPSMTAADRLRVLHPRQPEQSPSVGPVTSATGATADTVLQRWTTTAAVTAPLLVPRATGPIHYTREALLALRESALEAVRQGPIADSPPFTKLPASFVPLLRQRFALEYVNVDAATALVEGRALSLSRLDSPRPASAHSTAGNTSTSYSSPFTVTASDVLPPSMTSTAAAAAAAAEGMIGGGGSVMYSQLPAELVAERLHCYHCEECARGGPRPCEALATVFFNAKRYIMTQPLGRCLLQPKEVVLGQLQLALVFEVKQSSLRLRALAEKNPAIPRLVGEYLYGEGYHLPLPRVTAHEEWRTAMQMLKFDAIRDNRTRVVTDLSKHWKKRNTQFEQFVAFFGYRDDVPIAEVKNMLTRSVKPGMVAMLTGDVVAMILLHNLGFFIPPDYYWSVFPFLEQALDENTLTHDVVRHLGGYFSAKQDPNLYNPIVNPFTTYRM